MHKIGFIDVYFILFFQNVRNINAVWMFVLPVIIISGTEDNTLTLFSQRNDVCDSVLNNDKTG